MVDGHNFGDSSCLLPFLIIYQEEVIKLQNQAKYIAKYLVPRQLYTRIQENSTNR